MIQEIKGTTGLCGVIGNPIAHTFSPFIHNTIAGLMGTDLVYVPFHIREPETLHEAISGAYDLNILGMNVTVPYKSQVMPFLKEIDETAAAIGAVNTLVRVEGGYKGYNTDCYGLARALQNADALQEHVVIIGAGGAARAAGFMCGMNGVRHLVILNRTVERARLLGAELHHHFPAMGISIMPLAEAGGLSTYGGVRYLAIQCTKVGLAPREDETPIEDPAFYQRLSYAYDCIYLPENTRFLQMAAQQGVPHACGIEMLLWQGISAYELWTGTTVTDDIVDAVRQTLRAHLRG